MLVIFADGEEKIVPTYKLENLIQERKIVAFYRSDGWVRVDQDPVRKGPPKSWSGNRWSDFMPKSAKQ
jgi:hypothetical protein